MEKKKLISTLSAVVLATSLFSTSVLAKDNNSKDSLVALGDSISYGFNLENNNEHTSRDAFPYLIGKDATLRVRDLAIPGLKTTDFLSVLGTKKYQEAIEHADYITLTIGGNDLTAAFSDNQVTQQELSQILNNIKMDLQAIRKLTDAPIVLYNTYNPYQVTDTRHGVGNVILAGFNAQLELLVGYLGDPKIVVADAYHAFGDRQDLYVRVNDIHPTILGQQLLAQIGLEALGLTE